jgi:hypothetical protein
MHILLKSLLSETARDDKAELNKVDDNDDIIVYHAGPKKLKPSDIKFDLGALGFHVGTLSQATDFSTGNASRVKNAPISKFKLNDDAIIELDSDMAWEHPDLLLLDFVNNNIISAGDAHKLATLWGMDTNDFYSSDESTNITHAKIDKANRSMTDFYSGDEYDYNLSPEFYKNREKLGQLRAVLIKRFNGFKYPNDVEGDLGEYSYCILNPKMLSPV